MHRALHVAPHRTGTKLLASRGRGLASNLDDVSRQRWWWWRSKGDELKTRFQVWLAESGGGNGDPARGSGFGRFFRGEKTTNGGGEKGATTTRGPSPPGGGGGGGGPSTPPAGNNAWVAVAGATGLAIFMYMRNRDVNSGLSLSNGREIDFNTFANQYLAAGEVERLVVKNKSVCVVQLRRSTSLSSSSSSSSSSSTYGGGSFGSESSPPPPPPSDSLGGGYPRRVSATPGHVTGGPVYFTIGSIESFERRLEQVQKDLGIASKDFVPLQYVNETNFGYELMRMAPTLLTIGVMIAIFRSLAGGGPGGAQGGPMNQIFKIGKSPAKVLNKGTKLNVKFGDVAGCDEAKMEIMEFVDFLKDPKRFTELGAKIPRGCLLYGPPGTGKTLLAKAVAGEASVPFFSISGSDFIEMFVGVGPSRVRDLFAEARKNAPCIIFIDEIDAVARARGKGGFSGGNDERENTLNQLLVELDGFNTKEGVVVLGGTNRLDILDPAILRPGRFDRQIKIDLPDIRGRKEIFLVHMKKVKIDGVVEEMAQRMAALTPGFSGAQIANVVNEAAILAAREKAKGCAPVHFDRAVDRVIGGLERRTSLMSVKERTTIAVHEAGHAIAGWFLEHADPLLKVTIVPRISGALGYAQYLPKELSLFTRDQLEDRMCMTLAGRAAEELTFGTVTTGASDDLDKVTKMAYAMVTSFGMSPKIGQVAFRDSDQGIVTTKPYSDATAQTIDEEAREIVGRAYVRVKDLLREHVKDLEAVSKRLVDKEVIDQHDIAELVGPRKWKIPQSYAEFVEAGDKYKKPAAAANEATNGASTAAGANEPPSSPSGEGKETGQVSPAL